MLAGGVEHVAIVRTKEDREVPLEAVLHALGPVAHGVIGPYVDGPYLIGAVVVAGQEAAVATAVYDVRILGVRGEVGRLPAGRRFPVRLTDGAPVTAVADSYGRVILLRPVDAVGEAVVGRDAVELCRWLVHVGVPVLPLVKADLSATIIGDDHTLVVLGGNP